MHKPIKHQLSVADKVEVKITILPDPTRGFLCLYKVGHKLLLIQ